MAQEPLLRILAPAQRVFIYVSLTDLRQPQWGYLSKPWWTFIDHHIQAADRYGRAPADQLFHATRSEGK